MNISKGLLVSGAILFAPSAGAWEANVTDILQHGTAVAVFLNPDPGPGNCQVGSPYILNVDDTPESKQRFAMILTAIATGQKVAGYPDACSTAIWGQSRPTVVRLILRNS